MFLNDLLNVFIQLLVFALIPFIFFLITRKKHRNFFNYIGLYRSTRKANMLAFLIAIIILVGSLGIAMFSPEMKSVLDNPQSVSGKFKDLGFSAQSVVLLLFFAWIKTALAEEIFFRGFLAKRMIASFGFVIGNGIQAFLFGLLHLVLFWKLIEDANAFFLTFIFLVSGLSAYLMCYLNEKHARGSILPGWLAHGTANMVTYAVIAYVM